MKKIISIVIAVAIFTIIFSADVYAGGAGIIIRLIYVDSEVMIGDFKDSPLESFEPDAIKGAFVLSCSDVDFTINEYQPSWNTSEAFKTNGCYWQTSVNVETMGLIAGTYTLKECPVPDGYEITEIYPKNTIKQETLDDPYALEVFYFYIRLRETGAAANNQEPEAPQQQPLTAIPTAAAVLVNGQNIAFDAYNINGNNYFKLRDLAYVLNGSGKQFEVGWDSENNAISLSSGVPYTEVGGEMTGKGTGEVIPISTTSRIYLDGNEISLTAYNIEGNNYFKLRDIGQAFDIGVDWDEANNTIVIDTTIGYAQ